MLRRAMVLLPSLLVIACSPTQDDKQPSDQPTVTPSDFVRFVRVGEGGHLDTAITTYRKGEVEVLFYGAVHIADEAVYETLNDRFTTCDALLYELVGPPDYRPTKHRESGFNPLTLLQKGMRNSMELTFQLDVIDYQPENFVHADMTPEEFKSSMEERGESLLSIMFDMMISGMERQREKANAEDQPEPIKFDLVTAFRSGEGRHLLRMTLATQLEEMEMMAAGGKEGGSTLLEGRNEKCLEVLHQQIAAGKKRLGIYYGAAHLPHMERRLVDDLGFEKVGHEWLVAWDCEPRADPKYDRGLVKLRRRCGKEIAVIAEAGRWQRRRGQADGDDKVMTIHELRKAPREGAEPYTGPVEDPWGNDYVIEKRATGSRWQFRSLGQDGKLDTADDMVVQEPRRGGLRIF